MGFIVKGFKVTTLVLIAIFFAPGLPPHFDFESLSPPGTPELKGPLTPNNILDKAKLMPLDEDVDGPESIAVRGDELYTGLNDGSLIKIKNGKVSRIGPFGKNCDNSDPKRPCGRIGGVRFDSKGKLLVANTGFGIYRVDVDTEKVEQLVGLDAVIDGRTPKFPNDVIEDSEGNIYWSDSSSIVGPKDLLLEGFAGPSGRLVKSNLKTKENTVLIPKLQFANGIQLSKNEDFILVAEMFRARVWRYYLKGEKKGTHDIFVKDLPGLPDNVRPNGRGGFYISLILPRIPGEFSPLEALGEWPLTRRFIVRVHHIILQALIQIDTFLPSPVLKDSIQKVRMFGMLGGNNKVLKSIVVETDGEGKIIRSLQNDKGPVTTLSEMSVDKTWAYFASPTGRGIYRLSLSELTK